MRYALDVLGTLPDSAARHDLASGSLDWLATVSNADGGVPFVLPSGTEQPAAVWLVPSPESSLLATAQLAAAALRLGLDHPWIGGATDFCWARFGEVTPSDAYTFTYGVDLLDATPDRARADAELDRLAAPVPADGRINVAGAAEGEEIDPLAIAPWSGHAGARLFTPAVLDRGLDALEAGQQADGGRDFSWAKWNPAAA